MQLTQAQLATLKTWLDANAVGLNDEQAAALLNANDPGGYKVWRSSLSKQDLVERSDLGLDGVTVTTFAVGGGTGSYIDRSVGERDGFALLFNSSLMCKPYLANVRIAFFDLSSGAASLSAQNRTHFWARGQRVCTVGEKLYVVATVGGPTHNAANGNNPQGQTGTRGTWTNPDTLGTGLNGAIAEGQITVANVSAARQP